MSEKEKLRDIAWKFNVKLSKIKVFLADIDGILTDGRVYYDGEEIGFNRLFHVRDGYGFKMLQEAGLKVGFISGGVSTGVEKRAKALGIDYVFLGNEDKRSAYQKVLDDGYNDEEILYVADEFFDLPLLKRAGFSATVQEASEEIHEAVDYVCRTPAGYGVARELIDMIRYAQHITPDIPDFD